MGGIVKVTRAGTAFLTEILTGGVNSTRGKAGPVSGIGGDWRLLETPNLRDEGVHGRSRRGYRGVPGAEVRRPVISA